MAHTGVALCCAILCLFSLAATGEAYAPLHVEGQGGFWNQVVIGKDKAYNDRIGGLTIKGERPVVSLLDREAPIEYAKRWDLISTGGNLEVWRARKTKMMSLDTQGNAIFKGKMKVDGVMRVKNLALDGIKSTAEQDTPTLKIGADTTANMRIGSDDKTGWVQSGGETTNEHLAINPHPKESEVKYGTTMFSDDVPKHTVDVKGDLYVQSKLKLGKLGKTSLEKNKLEFAMGGGWTSSDDSSYISTLDTTPVQFGGAVFGTRLGIGTDEVKDPSFRLQVHDGHFVVTSQIGSSLKGLTTYVMPESSHMKAYDYTLRALQKWRITGTKILLNPGQKTDGRVCIGCEKPEHHLQSQGNMYVNGNIFVNKHLHVKGQMDIDKIITPRVFIHSRMETPQYGEGIMIGDALTNKYGTKTTMRLGYAEKYGWIQSHQEVPLVINPIGGGTCIGCKIPDTDIELKLGGNGFFNGELFVATLNNQKKATEPSEPPEADNRYEDSTEGKFTLQDSLPNEEFTLDEAQSLLETEVGSKHMNVMSALSSATKVVQHNHNRILDRQSQIQQNEAAIRALEEHLLSKQ